MALATVLIAAYSFYAVRLATDLDELYTDYIKGRFMQWINSAVFTVLTTIMSLLMICKLRVRFDDFYFEYGCVLWTVIIIQSLALVV